MHRRWMSVYNPCNLSKFIYQFRIGSYCKARSWVSLLIVVTLWVCAHWPATIVLYGEGQLSKTRFDVGVEVRGLGRKLVSLNILSVGMMDAVLVQEVSQILLVGPPPFRPAFKYWLPHLAGDRGADARPCRNRPHPTLRPDWHS